MRDVRRVVRLGGVGALTAAALLADPALGADTEPVRFQLTAPSGCPDADAFAAQVQARTPKARVAGAADRARTFSVTVTGSEGARRGTLAIQDLRGARTTRSVSSEKCDEVVAALALVAALAIDPEASTAPAPPPPPPRPPPPPPAPPSPRPPPPRFEPRVPWWGPIGDPLPVFPPAKRSRVRLSHGLEVLGVSAVAPNLALVIGGHAEVSFGEGRVLAPAIRLSVLQAQPLSGLTGASAWRFSWTAGRLEGCPVRLQLVPSLDASPCAFFEAGSLFADGHGRGFARSAHRPWAAPGALARLAWEIQGRLSLEAQGGATFPLVRDTFYFQPSVTAHAVPVAGAFFGGGVGFHFP